MVEPAEPELLNEFLTCHVHWRRQGGQLERVYQAENPRAALAKFARIGELAEAANHHPVVTWSYDQLRILLTTHDVPTGSALTHRDVKLAQDIEKVLT